MFPVLALLTLTGAPQQPLATPATPTERLRRPEAPYSLPPVSGRSRDGAPVPLLVPAQAPAPVAVAVTHTDDGVPLPVPAKLRATETGDVLETAASGDPFFLGFSAGAYRPLPAESVGSDLYAAVARLGLDERPAPETYAFVMFAKRMTPERLERLESLGCRLLGFHPHYTQKVALPAAAIDTVASLDFVRWVGPAQSWQKIHPRLAAQQASAQAAELLDVWINVFESDVHAGSQRVRIGGNQTIDPEGRVVQGPPVELERVYVTDGWQSRALVALGVEVGNFMEGVNAFRARVPAQGITALAELDFVQFIEPSLVSETHHDQSMPMTNQDDVRSFFDGSVNEVAIAGVVDSGVETAHQDINVFAIGTNLSTATTGAFDDADGHGTHVAGTLVGEGKIEAGHTGAAPGLGFDATHPLHVARISNVGNFTVDYTALLGWMTSVQGVSAGLAHVFNNSWGTTSTGGYFGSEVGSRVFDESAYDFGQLNVFSAGNDGPNPDTLTSQASAKNTISVGNVYDTPFAFSLPGTVATDSSRGPTGDGRWKPTVCAPGNLITSADAFDLDDYTVKAGTSMAAPHVTGLIASLIDKESGTFAYLPERIAAQLMATAVRKDDVSYTNPFFADLDVYGAGRVHGTNALWSGPEGTWTSWGFSLGSSSSTFGDFTVPSNATRIVAVMHYVEDAASAGASQALINDFDFYLDQPPLSSGNNTGEWQAQQSALDNVELRVLENPIAGTWRWKVWPDSATSTVFAGVTIYVQTSITDPTIAPTLTASDLYPRPDEVVTFQYDLSSGSTLSGVYLEPTPTGSTTRHDVRTILADGIVTDLSNSFGYVTLGNVHPWVPRTAEWDYSWSSSSEGNQFVCIEAFSDNASNDGDIECLQVVVDGTLPPIPQPSSFTYTPGVWTAATSGSITWPTVVDPLSGLDGYSSVLTSIPNTPPQTINVLPTTTLAFVQTPTTGSYWYNLRAVDKAGNWGTTAFFGPLLVDLTPPAAVTSITSQNHQPNVQSCASTLDLDWAAGTDADSGVAGYAVLVDSSPNSTPGTAVVTGTPSYTEELGDGTWYVHVSTVDNVGNVSPPLHFGPLLVDTTPVSTYCTAKANSQGCLPTIGWIGTAPSASAGSGFHVTSGNTLDNKNGLFFYGYASKASQFQGGWLCVQAPVKRTAVQNSGGAAPCGGLFSFDFNAHIASGVDPMLTVGTTVYGQYWSRDPGVSFNTVRTDAIQMTICP